MTGHADGPVGLPDIPTRIVLAPMAGGAGTPRLVAAVSGAGGLGVLPSGYLDVDRLRTDLEQVRQATSAPFGVNLFVPEPPDRARMHAATAYAAQVRAWAGPAGLPTDPPRYSDDAFDAKLQLVLQTRPRVASFTFGLPPAAAVSALHEVGVCVLVTVTTVDEAVQAEGVGADGLVVQGNEAGAHRGGWTSPEGDLGLLALLQLVRAATPLPLVAAGGIATGAGIAAVLAAGAEAAMLGTAFLRCPEAGTAPAHSAALSRPTRTVLTRAFTGRPARALQNRLTDQLGPRAPHAYPEVHFVTAPLRAAARDRADTDTMHLWAGQAHALARPLPAASLVDLLATETAAAAERLRGRLPDRRRAGERGGAAALPVQHAKNGHQE